MLTFSRKSSERQIKTNTKEKEGKKQGKTTERETRNEPYLIVWWHIQTKKYVE